MFSDSKFMSNWESIVRHVMSHTLSQEVALEYNWVGKGSKKPFEKLSYRLKKVILDAVRGRRQGSTNNEIEKTMKECLRYAKDREGGRRKRLTKKLQQQREENENDM
ncbi:uncharacterized protein LOC132719726 [Ruditapes philippinarum]|uniref:uncharacterized protein LOC132719726 n=1 Tax=Ruditapes philippinarum TaxID=129788 RepID=UPI00295B843A|nr:uncharacterized protein LOC132719726 [Ruditapes philippinarum]